MKAILILDEIPNKCFNCRLMTDDMYCKGFKPYIKENNKITKMCVEDEVMRGIRHIHCPLIEINDNIAKLIEVAR